MKVRRWGSHWMGLVPAPSLVATVLFLASLAGQMAEAAAITSLASLVTGRYAHSVTLLTTGRVLVAGGTASGGVELSSAELYDPAANAFTSAASMLVKRGYHTATLLPSGKVLVVGGYTNTGNGVLNTSEIYDPSTNTWSSAGNLAAGRFLHTATLLPSGKVLVTGGYGVVGAGQGPIASAEMYDPATNAWSPAGNMTGPRTQHTATLLGNGQVLVVGGVGGLSTTETYDPATNAWTPAGSLSSGRRGHTATLLVNGSVLAVGGDGAGGVRATTERFDPIARTWSAGASIAVGRTAHAATILPSGKLFVAGGQSGSTLLSTEIYEPATDSWSSAGALSVARSELAAVLLPSGNVLLVGGHSDAGGSVSSAVMENYDPSAGNWMTIGNMQTERENAGATLLPSGKVLVVGGITNSGYSGTAEVFDPQSGAFSPAGSFSVPRAWPTATLLNSGKVLVAGGYGNAGFLASAELYDPDTNSWSMVGPMNVARSYHAAALLPSGKVLVVGGGNSGGYPSGVDVYDPATETWATANPIAVGRSFPTATLLPSGKVLVTGGFAISGVVPSADTYDPAADTWSSAAPLTIARSYHSATLLPNGRVLVAGGLGSGALPTMVEQYDPLTNTWSPAGSLSAPKYRHGAVLLRSGRVLVLGGQSIDGAVSTTESYDPATNLWTTNAPLTVAREGPHVAQTLAGQVFATGGRQVAVRLASAEVFDEGRGILHGRGPSLATVTDPIVLEEPAALTGTAFTGDTEASGGGTSGSPTNYPLVQLRRIDNGQSSWLPGSASVPFSATTWQSVAASGLNPGPHVLTMLVNAIPSVGEVVAVMPARVSTTTSVSSSLNPASFGQSVTFTATVSGTLPTGQVSFLDGVSTMCVDVALVGGQASCTLATLAAGIHSITAQYAGDAANLPSASSALAQTVNAGPTRPGVPVGVSAIAGNAQALVYFTPPSDDGGSPISMFMATSSPGGYTGACAPPCTQIAVPGLTNGVTYTFTVTARNGVGNGLPSAPSNAVTPVGATTTTALVSSSNPAFLGNSVTLTATVSGASPTGTVTFTDGGTPLCAAVTLSQGAASCTTGALTLGSHAIVAAYAGDAMNEPSASGVLSQTITAPPAAISVADGSRQSTIVGTQFTTGLSALVTDQLGNPVSGALVVFSLPASGPSGVFSGAGATISIATDTTGIAVSPAITANSAIGSYSARATVAGVARAATFLLTNLASAAPNPWAHVQSTYLGGPSTDYQVALGNRKVAVDSSTGDVFVIGTTQSTDFPGTVGGLQPTKPAATAVAAIARLDSSLQGLRQATYLGGSGVPPYMLIDYGTAIAIHPTNGDVYVVLQASSIDLPGTAGGAMPTAPGGQQSIYVARIDRALSRVVQATYVAADDGSSLTEPSLAISQFTGDVYLASRALAATFPGASGGAQPANAGDHDVLVVRLDSTLTQLRGATFLGGSGREHPVGMTIDPSSGVVYVAGNTNSPDLPATSLGAIPDIATTATWTGFVSRLDRDLRTIERTTYFHGNGATPVQGISQNRATGEIYVYGSQEFGPYQSTTLPALAGGAQQSIAGNNDGFVARLSSDLQEILQSTFLGGNGYDGVSVADVDTATGEVIVAGFTARYVGNTFPRTGDALQADCTMNQGVSNDAIVTRFNGALTSIISSTCLGGHQSDDAIGIHFDSSTRSVYVLGTTSSTDFPGTSAGVQPANAGSNDLHITRISLPAPGAVAAFITASNGDGQSAQAGGAFALPLQATVTDSTGTGVAGLVVTFALPSTGASGTYGGQLSATAVTDVAGVAKAPTLHANTSLGTWTATATVAGVATPATFALTNLPGAPASLAIAGTPQTTLTGTLFPQTLDVTVSDAWGNKVPGVNVTFTSPPTGASGNFPGNVRTTVVPTNASGVASTTITANGTAGTFTVQGTVTGLAATSFALTSVPRTGTTITPVSGAQTTVVGTAFAGPLVAVVKDAGNNPVPNLTVTFTLPNGTLSAAFPGNARTAVALTDANGVASSPQPITATTRSGTFVARAAVAGVATTANFSMTNVPGAPATIAARVGGQSAAVYTTFNNAPSVRVADAYNNPVPGQNVAFALPSSGPTGAFQGQPNPVVVVTDAMGIATAPKVDANGIVGAYQATATAAPIAAPATFNLTNTVGAGAKFTVEAGSPQSVVVAQPFAPLEVKVLDAVDRPVEGVRITFSLPGSAASATFPGNVRTDVRYTDAAGRATSPIPTATTRSGSFTATARAAGIASALSFALTNLPDVPATAAANGVGGQTATVYQPFARAPSVRVRDQYNNGVPGVQVTFVLPTTGPSGVFVDGAVSPLVVATDATGVATAPLVKANGVVGVWYVSATAAGIATPVAFRMTNVLGAGATVTSSSGTTPQSTARGTLFPVRLAARVADALGNPVEGVNVTFTLPPGTAGARFGPAFTARTAVVATGPDGIATAPDAKATATAGSYMATAAAAGVTGSATFDLTNN